jgi:hypothetical protein
MRGAAVCLATPSTTRHHVFSTRFPKNLFSAKEVLTLAQMPSDIAIGHVKTAVMHRHRDSIAITLGGSCFAKCCAILNHDFAIGDDIEHPTFGEGIIIDIRGQGEKAEASIRFRLVGTKHLSLAWAPLKKMKQ